MQATEFSRLSGQPVGLEPLAWAPLRFRVRFTTAAWLPPFKGSTLRGGFGIALRRASCVRRGSDCETCTLGSVCPYRYVFETPVPAGSARMRRYPRCPHPFVLEPPADERVAFQPGDVLEFGLTLVGRAQTYALHAIYAVMLLGEELGVGRRRPPAGDREGSTGPPPAARAARGDGRVPSAPGDICGRYEVVAVTDGAEAEAGPLYEPDGQRLLREPRTARLVRDEGAPVVDSVRLQLVTPLRLVENGRLSARPSFQGVVRALLRRLSSLAYFHCGGELDLPYAELVRRAASVRADGDRLRWHDWERYSRRQKTRMRLGGVVGTLGFTGDLAPFLPLLAAGEVLHVGKATSFGLGAYGMEVDGGER
jgi:hypothetical protein